MYMYMYMYTSVSVSMHKCMDVFMHRHTNL